ncbi:hypothetical protein K491DRAFT_693461 [Lophiostoma macrostomum CBS 122681]|uniref:GPI inositol-deacylase winged helix domain-containing protein n=1 Tax=Lophiostoma macrostomum CBS 122681 TaxID=1314788 RepID=A0A6A6T676_9PLEO|nr:hypothetical protein K491DRAFT_693461 [Lophiostoma macrostomum CBS 122681]
MMTKVCQWISCARRPLLLTELEEAVGLDETDTHLHRERMATGSGEKLVGACGNLVVYDRDEKTIALAHHTVEQFLTASNPIQGTSGQHSIHFDKGVADHHIGKICIAYLRFTDFERQVYQPEQPVRMARKDAENIIWNRIPLSSSVRRIMSPANTTRRRTEYIFPTPKKGSNLEYTYTMLPYVIEFWLHHSSQFPVDKLNMDAFSHMVLHHRLPFEFRPWNMNKDSSTTPNMASWFPIYVWAMQSCMTSLFYVLFRDADIFAQMQQHFMQRLHGYDLSNHRQEIISQYYLFILSRHHLDSWAMKLSAAADYRESYHMLGLLLTELGKHCPSISTSILGPLFIDALGIAIEKGNFQAAIHIYELYIPDNITLSRLFIEMVDLLHVPAPVITCLLCIPTTDLIEIEDEFLTALKNFLPSLVEVLSISTFADLQLNEWCSSLCLRYTLNVHNDKWLQIVLNHKSKEMVVYPPASWVGSVENIPLARCLIQYYRKIQSENTACGAPMEQNILIKLIDLHPWDRFTVDDFEKADIRGLGWSSQMKMPEVARALTSRYKNHFLDLLVSGFPQDMTAWVFSTRAFNTLLQETSWSSNVVWTFVDYLALRPDINDFPDIMGIFVRLAIGLSPRPPSPQPPSQPSNTNPSPHSMNNRGGAR